MCHHKTFINVEADVGKSCVVSDSDRKRNRNWHRAHRQGKIWCLTHWCVFSLQCWPQLFVFCWNEGGAHKRKGGGERRHPSSAAKTHLQWKTDVSVSIHTWTLTSWDFSSLLQPFNTPALFFVFPQERWEDSCRLQDPRRLGAPPRVGAKRRLVAPPVLHIPPLLIVSCCHYGQGQLSAIALDVGHSPTVSQQSGVARCQADLKTR